MAKTMAKSLFTVGLLALLLAVPAFGASINKSIKIAASETSGGATSVNGSITVGENAVVTGGIKTVNGSIRVDDGAAIENASTVNGSVRVGDNVDTDHLNTVNGMIRVGRTSTVAGEIEAVNGKISVDTGSTVADSVSNVNGHIELTGAEIGGDVTTVTGDVSLSDSALVKGDLVVEKPSNWGWGKSKQRKPRIVIGPGSTVEGVVRLEREVELFISDTASVAGVEGVMSLGDAVRFSGERP
ncbi:MAG TPA: hypothetical protein PKH39_19400 [Woeseiaceae bacterium]|nr:hypothetical protein [Woeseiaceae bacterium]